MCVTYACFSCFLIMLSFAFPIWRSQSRKRNILPRAEKSAIPYKYDVAIPICRHLFKVFKQFTETISVPCCLQLTHVTFSTIKGFAIQTYAYVHLLLAQSSLSQFKFSEHFLLAQSSLSLSISILRTFPAC